VHVYKVPQIIVTAYVHKSRGKHSSHSPSQWSAKGTHNRYCLSLGTHNRYCPLLLFPHRHRCSPECVQYTFPASSLPPLKALSLAPHKVGLKHAKTIISWNFPYPFSLTVAKASNNQSRYIGMQGIRYTSRPCRIISHTHKYSNGDSSKQYLIGIQVIDRHEPSNSS